MNEGIIKALIIDDEQHCIDRLQTLLLNAPVQNIQVQGTCRSIDEAASAIQKYSPDLLFLDVQLGESTGFDLLQKINRPELSVIFTTAYDTYAVQAFRYSALDYLLKPIDEEDLVAALVKIRTKHSSLDAANRLNILFHNLNSASRRICIPDLNGFVYVAVNEIIRCQSKVNYTEIYLSDGRKLTVARTLKEFEEMLDGGDFFRIHNSHLINLKYIKRYQKGKGGSVVLNDDMEIEVSVRRKEEFLKRLNF